MVEFRGWTEVVTSQPAANLFFSVLLICFSNTNDATGTYETLSFHFYSALPLKTFLLLYSSIIGTCVLSCLHQGH